ncbi:MAG: TetR/AcrR family transcriptional regulator [Solirubrobacteraceae bacterium]
MKVKTRRRRTQAERRDETRRALLESADRAFSRDGFHAVSVDAIAEDAGYSKGAVYARFGGKDDLFLAVLQARFDPLALSDLDRVTVGGRKERIEALARAHRRVIGEDPAWTVAWVEFAAHATRDRDLSQRLRAVNARLRERAERQLAQLGFVDESDASYLTTVSLVYGSGVSIERMLDPDGAPEADLSRMARALAADIGGGEGKG